MALRAFHEFSRGPPPGHCPREASSCFWGVFKANADLVEQWQEGGTLANSRPSRAHTKDAGSVRGHPLWWEPQEAPPHQTSPSQVRVSTAVVKTDVAPVYCPGCPEPAWAPETRVPMVGGGAGGQCATHGPAGSPTHGPAASPTVCLQIHGKAVPRSRALLVLDARGWGWPSQPSGLPCAPRQDRPRGRGGRGPGCGNPTVGLDLENSSDTPSPLLLLWFPPSDQGAGEGFLRSDAVFLRRTF